MTTAKEAWQTSQPPTPPHRIRVSREGGVVGVRFKKDLHVDVKGIATLDQATDERLKTAIAYAVIRDVKNNALSLRELIDTQLYRTVIPRDVVFPALDIYDAAIKMIEADKSVSRKKGLSKIRMNLAAAVMEHLSPRTRGPGQTPVGMAPKQ